MNMLNNRLEEYINIQNGGVMLTNRHHVHSTLVSCDDDMDIQQSYRGHARAEQGSKGADSGNRCELKKGGRLSGTLYTIRYFQFEGEGSLKMDNGITFPA